MNDFTLEELIEILNGLDDYYLLHSGLKIGEKIQSMIDNYCEHQFSFRLNDSEVHCVKCGRGLNEWVNHED